MQKNREHQMDRGLVKWLQGLEFRERGSAATDLVQGS